MHWQALLLMILGLYLPLLIFILLALRIWHFEGGVSWDISCLTAIHQTVQDQFTPIVRILTNFGTRWGVIPGSILLSFAFLYQKRWKMLTYFLITMLGCGFINLTAKNLLHRPRPSLWDYPPHTGFSFPSGHAMSSMGLVAALVVLTWGSPLCKWVLILGGVFSIAIGWTRLYLGVHYPSDIVAGWMLAIAWAVGVRLVVKLNSAE